MSDKLDLDQKEAQELAQTRKIIDRVVNELKTRFWWIFTLAFAASLITLGALIKEVAKEEARIEFNAEKAKATADELVKDPEFPGKVALALTAAKVYPAVGPLKNCSFGWNDGQGSDAQCNEGDILLSGGCSFPCYSLSHSVAVPIKLRGSVAGGAPDTWRCAMAPSSPLVAAEDDKAGRRFHAVAYCLSLKK